MDIVLDIVKKYFLIVVRRKTERNTGFHEFYWVIFCMIFDIEFERFLEQWESLKLKVIFLFP